MDRLWKQFAAWATDSGSNVFLQARLRLTALYVLIVAVIIFGFSIFLYQSISHNLRDVRDDDFADSGSHQHFVQNTLDSVGSEIVFADLIILLLSAAVSYLLAGRTLRPIQRALEAQREFAANASHELRTPLAVMQNDIEVFLRNPSPARDSVRATMDSNLEEIARMSGIVGNLLVLARADSDAAPHMEAIDLAALARSIEEKIHPLAQSKGIILSCAPSEPLIVQGAAHLLERVLMNILQNAIDHTPQGGAVAIATAKEGPYAIVSVTDTGTGITEKDLPHVFKRFYKGESATGTGLGLSIVKEIVSQHGGKITLASNEGEGAAATIRIPLK